MIKRLITFRFLLIVLMVILSYITINKIMMGNEPLTSLELALKAAGENREELEKVLNYYRINPSDSLKYKAACFLIENMPSYKFSNSEQLESYKSYYSWLKKSPEKNPEEISDSIIKTYGPMENLDVKYDIKEVDSAYLCHNIEWAFKVWKEKPWSKNISFEVFCEYILPYRIDNEPLDYWREIYYKKYNSILDSLKLYDNIDVEDPVAVANFLIERLPDKKHYFTTVVPYSFDHIGPEYVQYLAGSCRETADFGVYLLRAFGIPCTIDYIPVCNNANTEHSWLVTWDKNNEDYMTHIPDLLKPVRMNEWYKNDDSSKVYRYLFSINKDLQEKLAHYEEEVYPFDRFPRIVDVTQNYAYFIKKRLHIPYSKLYLDQCRGKIAYLCSSSWEKWVPVDWAECDPKNLVFTNIKKGAVMRVATYQNGILHFITDPFYIDKQTNELHFYTPGKEKQDVVFYSKYPVEDIFSDRMLGGVFEGSNFPDFHDSDTLHIIQRKPNRLNTIVNLKTDKKYRYFRYVGAKNTWCNIAEIALYQKNDSTPLKGSVIGTPGCKQKDGSHEYSNAFDGKTWTSFDYIEPSGGWTGMDIGREIILSQIVFTPRNRDDYIRPGDCYELFYCDGDWQSLGMVQASADSLTYNNVPQNVLLLLRNHTRGINERIFIYENGNQLWK